MLVSDLHSSARALDRISNLAREVEPDAILIAGDLTTFGPPGYVDEVAKLAECRILAVTGNCDVPEVAVKMDAAAINVSDSIVRLGGLDVAGVAWAGGKRVFEAMNQGLAARLAERDESRPLIVLSHCPALGTLDEIKPGQHIGSLAISELVASARPTALFSGHAHEARGLLRSDGTVYANPGPAMEGHAALATYENGRMDAALL
ncbi:MAG: metallophosphoesterase family protein [Methanobacteriota archaeon]